MLEEGSFYETENRNTGRVSTDKEHIIHVNGKAQQTALDRTQSEFGAPGWVSDLELYVEGMKN